MINRQLVKREQDSHYQEQPEEVQIDWLAFVIAILRYVIDVVNIGIAMDAHRPRMKDFIIKD